MNPPAGLNGRSEGLAPPGTLDVPPIAAMQHARYDRRYFLAWMCCFLALGMGFALCGEVVAMGQALRAQRWPLVAGEVTEASLQTCWRGRNGHTLTGYTLRYRYTYQGKALVGQALEYGHPTCPTGSVGEPTARQMVERYPVGAAVEVAVNPERPADAFLRVSGRQVQATWWRHLAPKGLAVVILLAVAWQLFRTRASLAEQFA